MPIIGFKGVMGDHSIKVQKEIFNKCIFCLFKLPKYILELIIIITIIIIIIIIITIIIIIIIIIIIFVIFLQREILEGYEKKTENPCSCLLQSLPSSLLHT